MERFIAVCAVLSVLLSVSAASVLKEEQREALLHKKYAHLQVEIDEWKRLGKPTELSFPHKDGSTVNGLLVDLPHTASIFSTDYAGNTHFYLFTRENQNGSKVSPSYKDFKAAGWKADRLTKFIIHGFSNDITSEVFASLVPDLLNRDDYNVIGVDWGNLALPPFYIEARNHVSGVGKVVAKLVDTLVQDGGLDLADVHVLGHSLGAHVAGNTGKHVTTGSIGRITGMDPAMPLFLLLKTDRLSKDDADLVDVVHTCSGLLGLDEAIGHVDFYPNGGSRPQPGCGVDLVGTCSHGRAYLYMAESADEPESFKARECASAYSAEDGDCSNVEDGKMGIDVKFNSQGTGTYYLTTASAAPFDLQAHAKVEGSKGRRVEGGRVQEPVDVALQRPVRPMAF